jgi:nicotinate phosphoribosyltransferase
MIDLAKRAHDHSYKLDPIIRSLLDTDFYKFLMMQIIWAEYFMTRVTFGFKNRTKRVKLPDWVNIAELREQLDHVRTLKFQPGEIIWLAGNTFFNQSHIFRPGFLDYLRTFSMPDYHLEQIGDEYVIEFSGPWVSVTLWEIFALSIVNELLARGRMKKMSKSQLDIMYARAKTKLYAKLEKLATVEHLNLSDFGTRRRHSFLWQEYCVLLAKDVLGDRFTGTSNTHLAMKHGLEAKGTNAHELPMTLTALIAKHGTVEEIKQAQYDVLRTWQSNYRGNMLVFLPDTFGTTQFLNGAPQWVRDWKGARPDSKDPIIGGEELIDWWGQEASEKLIIFSDGLDVKIDGFEPNGKDILAIEEHFRGRALSAFGWGTNFTNDFLGCAPGMDYQYMSAISAVAKIKDADGHPAVKLSDNYEKATGPQEEVEKYFGVFGHEGMANAPVLV